MGLEPEYLNRYPTELSGGKFQRVVIAKILLLKLKFISTDEPISMLDVFVQVQIVKLLMGLRDKFNIVFYIVHGLELVKYIADKIAVMYSGEIIELAPTRELFKNPLYLYSKLLIKSTFNFNSNIN